METSKFLSIFSSATAEQRKANFEDYWGQSLVNVLRALHFIQYKKGFDNYKPGSNQSNINDSWFIK